MSGLLLPALTIIGVFIALMYIFSRTSNEANVRDRLERMVPGSEEASAFPDAETYNPETDFLHSNQEKSGIAVFGEQVMRMLGKDIQRWEKELQIHFVQAGIYSPNAVGYLAFFRFVAFPLSILFALYLMLTAEPGSQKLMNVFGGIAMVVLAWYGPSLYITNKKQKRQKVLQRSFPDTLDLILVCVESGLALDAALARVCRELGRAHPEITKELNRTRMELTLMNDRTQALHNLAERTDMVAFRSLVAALLQTEKFGTSLTETLRVLSDDFRQTRLMIAENKAGRLPALMTIPLILLLMPAFIMIVMGPALIKATEALSGVGQ